MNSNFKTQLLLKLANKKANKGFTLIELLVVTIIVGVLAAVALPNLLNQVGKAREVEAKNGMGAINRAQQVFHAEQQDFANAADPEDKENELGVLLKSQYFTFNGTAAVNEDGGNDSASANVAITDETSDGVRGYASGISYTDDEASYSTAICVSNGIGVVPTVGVPADGANDCTDGKEIESGE